MTAIIRGAVIGLVVLLQACGGGGSGSKNPGANSSVAVSSAAAIISSSGTSLSVSSSISSANSSSLSSSSVASLPADFPTGTVDALPVLNITTEGSAPILSRETYVNASFTLAGEGIAAVAGVTEIRGRGNSTWDWDKKPYRLKLSSSTEILGMPASKHWVLLANYADKTLMRNDIAFMFSRSLGLEYTPRDKYVELTLNGAYQGVYQLVEHIRVAKIGSIFPS